MKNRSILRTALADAIEETLAEHGLGYGANGYDYAIETVALVGAVLKVLDDILDDKGAP